MYKFVLFTLQDFPFELRQQIEIRNGHHVIMTALQRRMKYFDRFSVQLRNHPVVEIMERCLSDSPLDRPTARELEDSLESMTMVRLVIVTFLAGLYN